MHIIFGHISRWNIFLLIILNYFKLNVFYLYIEARTEEAKNEIAKKLKKYKVYPLPIELEKKIFHKSDYSICDHEDLTYRKNIKLVPDKIIQNYCNLFSIDEEKKNKLRLLIQDFLGSIKESITKAGALSTWFALYKSKKIFYIDFKFLCFYIPDDRPNVYKIIIPIDLFTHLIRKVKKIFLIVSSQKNKTEIMQKSKFVNEQNLKKFEKKTVALVLHKGTIYGSKDHKIFDKTLYYSDDKNSCLNKLNILHLDYDNFSSPEENLNWVCLNKIKISVIKVFLKTLVASVKTFFFIRSWSEFLGWLFCIFQYNKYLKYCEAIQKFKNLKIALIDYDVLCPKALILALEKNKIKTIATQERLIHTFYTPDANVILDTYYVASEFIVNSIRNSKYLKYFDIKNLIPVGLPRSDYLSLYKKGIVPNEISEAKENGKKIIIALGYNSPNNWYESYTSINKNWSAQLNFLENMFKLLKNLKNTFIVLRYKELDWFTNPYFKEILNKINDCENIVISNNYKESFYAYKLCAKADLVIAKHTSLADECLMKEIPVLFYEYSHNQTKLVSEIFDYLSSKLICYNFEELLERTRSLIIDDSSKLREEISKLNKTVYYLKEKGNVKNRILAECMKIIQKCEPNKIY